MRTITIVGNDIAAFYESQYDLLVLIADDELTHINHDDLIHDAQRPATTYGFATTHGGDEVQILLERSTIEAGKRFPGALDDAGHLMPAIADKMAGVIAIDGILPGRVMRATTAWTAADQRANALALERAHAVADLVAALGDNQSEAGRRLSLTQSTVNKLIKKANMTPRPAPADTTQLGGARQVGSTPPG